MKCMRNDNRGNVLIFMCTPILKSKKGRKGQGKRLRGAFKIGRTKS